MKHEPVPRQAVVVKDTYTRERAPEGAVSSATASISSTSIEDTVSPMSSSSVLYGVAMRRASEARRCA